jgi:hypothetical protein
MTFAISHDFSHRDAVQASRNALTVALATLETIDQGLSVATERLSTVTGKLRSGDQTVTTTQLRNAKDDVERHGYLHAGAANSARAAENGVVNNDTAIADAVVSHLLGNGHAQFPVDAVVGVNDPTAELVNPLRPMIYVQQRKPANLSAGGRVSGECMVYFYPRTTLEQAPDKVHLFRMLQAANLDIDVDNANPTQLGILPLPTGYRITAKHVLPSIPTLRGGPQFDEFLKARGNVALSRLMKKAGLNGVVNSGAVTISGPSEAADGITTQTVALRFQVGAPDQYGDRQEVVEAICLEACHAALKVDGSYGYVGNLTVQDGGKVPTIKLSTTVRTLSTEPKVTAEAVAIFTLRYRHEDAAEDVATGNPDDVVTGADGEEHYGWEIGN